MRLALRTDASERIGTGHLRRCLALADALGGEGIEVLFVVRQHDAHSTLASDAGRACAWLPPPSSGYAPVTGDPPHAAWAGVPWTQDAQESVAALRAFRPDWVLVDHYAFDARWHARVSEALGCRIAAIDDLADRPLAVRLLVDPNLHADHAAKYAGRLEAERTRVLGGPGFALLTPGYADAPRYRFRRHAASIGIFMGGSDPDDHSSRVLAACREAGFAGPIELVSSSRSRHHGRHLRLARELGPTRVLADLPDLQAFFGRHDLQVGSGGGAAWERCCLGVPTLALQIAENQRQVLPALAATGAVEWARPEVAARPGALPAAIGDLLASPRRRLALARAARQLVDGHGARRVAAAFALQQPGSVRLRLAGPADEALLLAWANDPLVRTASFQSGRITAAGHHQWFHERLARTADCLLLVATSPGGVPAGVVRFEQAQGDAWTIGFSVDAAYRGCGLAAAMLHAAVRELRVRFGAVPVEGLVRPGNAGSLATFRRLGFAESTLERCGTMCHRFRLEGGAELPSDLP